MYADLFARGLAVGFAIAFALGPIGLLVIRRTIERGWRLGFLSGLGVAAADATYGAIAAFGVTALTNLLVGADRVLGIVGGTVLVVLAVRGARSALGAPSIPAEEPTTDARSAGRLRGPLGAWGSMYALTLTNPATIISFAALFASLGAGSAGPGGALAVVAGVFTGSVIWWALLTGIVAGARGRLTPRVVRWLNLGSAILIGVFGVIAILLGILG